MSVPTMLDHALRELALGSHVFPLVSRTKIPFGPHACPHPHEHGFKDATDDPAIVRAWWSAHPDANNAAALEPSGQVLLDYDRRSDLTGGAEDELYAALGLLPETRIVLSRPDGSRHRLFRANGTTYTSAPTCIPGIEIKHKDGYRVGVGSIHPDTGLPYGYDAVTADLPLALCPDLSPILRPWKEAGVTPPVPEQIPQGERHHTLMTIAAAMRRRGLVAEEMLPTLLAVNAARCVPPVEERQVLAIAKSVTKLYQPADSAFAPVPDGAVADGLRIIAADEVRMERVAYLHGQAPRIPLGMVTLLVGEPGLGKTQEMIRVTAAHPGVTIFLTAEDNHGSVLVPRLVAAGADRSRVKFVVMRRDGADGDLVFPDDIGALDRVVGELGASLVCVDPVVAYLSDSVDSHRDHSVRRVIAPLHRLAEAHRCAVLGTLHLNKKETAYVISRIGMSIGFQGAARSIMLLARDPDDPEGERGTRRVLAHVKCNYAPLATSLAMQIDQQVVVADEGERIETSRIRAVGESRLVGSDLLHTTDEPGGDRRSDRGDAVDFLQKELARGGLPVTKVTADAGRLGFSVKTLRRAGQELGIKPQREGFGKEGGWWWGLPGWVLPEGGRAIDGQVKDGQPQDNELAIFDETPMDIGPQGSQPAKDGQLPATDEGGHLWGAPMK